MYYICLNIESMFFNDSYHMGHANIGVYQKSYDFNIIKVFNFLTTG